ncbi:MAG: LAGLIDADG family homing endonuclease [Nanoarchaeota archaeon]
MSAEQFELLGIHIGDGCLSKTNKYKEYALLGDITEEREYYESHIIPMFNKVVMKPLLNKKVVGKSYPSMGVFGFLIFNSKIFEHYINLGIKSGPKTSMKLPKLITNAKPDLQRAFLRGLFDTDGSIYFDKNYSAKHNEHRRPRIKWATTSKILKN